MTDESSKDTAKVDAEDYRETRMLERHTAPLESDALPTALIDRREPGGIEEFENMARSEVESQILGQPPVHRSPIAWLAGALALLAALSVGWFLRERNVPKPDLPEVIAPAPEPAPETALEIDPSLPAVPNLADSDAFLRELAGRLVGDPLLASWLAVDELARRFTTTADNLAEGVTPRTQLGTLRPVGRFQAEERGGRSVITQSSYARYNGIAAAVGALNAGEAVRLYRHARPVLIRAYENLGYPGRNFDDTLVAAIDHLLAAPNPEGPVVVEKKVASWRYADDRLEALSPAQKHLLRMGPTNARKVRATLRALRVELNRGAH